MKDDFRFKSQQLQEVNLAKVIWAKNIPPSKSLLVWKIMHDKVPCDDKHKESGCNIPSVCNLCGSSEESTFQLFLLCAYFVQV